MPELTPIQSQVLAGLLAGGSIAAVAREHKIHRSTIYNWQHDCPAFTYALKEARARHRATMYDAAQDLAARAYETLGALLASDDEGTRLRAAQAILRAAAPSSSRDAESADALDARLASGASRVSNQLQRQAAIRQIAPADRPLLNSTIAPVSYPDREIDTVRHNSTVQTASTVESPAIAIARAA